MRPQAAPLTLVPAAHWTAISGFRSTHICAYARQAAVDETITANTKWSKSAVQLQQQRVYAVKPGINSELDLERDTSVLARVPRHLPFAILS